MTQSETYRNIIQWFESADVLKENLIDTTDENLSQLKYEPESVLGYVEVSINPRTFLLKFSSFFKFSKKGYLETLYGAVYYFSLSC